MPRILVLFGTTDGHTAKVAHALGSEFRQRGHEAHVVDAALQDADPDGFDAVIVAASVHAGKYQPMVVRWVQRHSTALNRMPAAFVSVCLGVLQHDPKVDSDLQGIVEAFLRSTSWQPLETKLVAGALLYKQYNFFKRWIMRRIAKKAGGGTDTSRDYEYTDWADLRQFADRFSQRLEPSTSARSA